MYKSEKVFIKNLIACLIKMGVKQIPFGNDDFNEGILCMQQLYIDNYDELGKYGKELGKLFLKRPLGREFAEFEGVITSFNGSLLAFENPSYIKADIKVDEDGADYVLNRNELGIDQRILYEFTSSFCKGARIAYR